MSTDNMSDGVSELSKKLVKEATNCEYEEIVGLTVKDAAYKAVASLLKLEEDTCDIHDTDKVGKSVIGELVRTRNKF